MKAIYLTAADYTIIAAALRDRARVESRAATLMRERTMGTEEGIARLESGAARSTRLAELFARADIAVDVWVPPG